MVSRLLINNLKLKKQTTSSKNVPEKFYYVWNFTEWGGAQIHLLSLMKEVKKYGEVVAIMPVGSSRTLQNFLDDIEVSYKMFESQVDSKPAPTIKRKLERHWNKIKSEVVLLRFLNTFDFRKSIIHIELVPWQSLLTLIWLSRKTNVFVTLHTSILPIPKFRHLLWQAKFRILANFKNLHIFTANQDAKNSLRSVVSEDVFERVTLIRDNVDSDEVQKALKIDRVALKKKYNLPLDKFLVFCVGRFTDLKGRWIFLEAAKKMLETNDDTVFVWLSNDQPTDEDLRQVQSYGIGNDFILITSDKIGRSHTDLLKLLSLADVFALPSFLEGLPISLLEAMALGVASISTNINGVPEAIKHLETGFLIETGNSEALKNAILTLKNDSQLRAKLANCGREFVLANFDQKNAAKMAVKKYFEAFQLK